MKAIIETGDYIDEGEVIATRITDEWYLFRSEYDGRTYYVDPCIVEFC